MDYNMIYDHEQDLSVGSITNDKRCNRDVQEAYTRMDVPFMNNAQVSNLNDHKHILSMVLLTVQQSLMTAKTDIEHLMLLLNQEMEAKGFLISKVKNLEEDLNASKTNIKGLQKTILAERGRITKIQWDTDEYLRKVLQIESMLKLEESKRIHADSKKITTTADRELLLQKLSSTKKDLEKLEKRLAEVEMKSKADLKVLIKEVKFLRKSQESIRQLVDHCIREKNEIEMVLQKETQRRENAVITRQLLSGFEDLRRRLEECSVDFLADDEEKFTVNSASLSDALGLLITSDNRISLLMAQAEQLALDDPLPRNWSSGNSAVPNVDNLEMTNEDARKLLAETIADNGRLRRKINTIMRCALKGTTQLQEGNRKEVSSGKKFLSWF